MNDTIKYLALELTDTQKFKQVRHLMTRVEFDSLDFAVREKRFANEMGFDDKKVKQEW